MEKDKALQDAQQENTNLTQDVRNVENLVREIKHLEKKKVQVQDMQTMVKKIERERRKGADGAGLESPQDQHTCGLANQAAQPERDELKEYKQKVAVAWTRERELVRKALEDWQEETKKVNAQIMDIQVALLKMEATKLEMQILKERQKTLLLAQKSTQAANILKARNIALKEKLQETEAGNRLLTEKLQEKRKNTPIYAMTLSEFEEAADRMIFDWDCPLPENK